MINLSTSRYLKKVDKFKVVVGLDVLASLPFLYFFYESFYGLFLMDLLNPSINQSPPRGINEYLIWLGIPLIGAILPLVAAFRLNKSPGKKNLYFGVIIFHLCFWVISLFLMFFGASNLFLASGWLLIILTVFLMLWRINKKLAVMLTLISLMLTIYGFISSFEESYCWDIGARVEQAGGVNCLPPTEDEKKDDPGISCIAPGWRAHLQCHRDFNFKDALYKKLNLK